jgi:hypothetical protein
MFSAKEKRKIAEAIEKVLLEIDHPEMPKEKPVFHLHVDGKEAWSWADIQPNWMYDDVKPANPNPWNEIAREVLKEE